MFTLEFYANGQQLILTYTTYDLAMSAGHALALAEGKKEILIYRNEEFKVLWCFPGEPQSYPHHRGDPRFLAGVGLRKDR